jgi:hypothetical protein
MKHGQVSSSVYIGAQAITVCTVIIVTAVKASNLT